MQIFEPSQVLPVGEHSVPRPVDVLQTANDPPLVATDLQMLKASALRHVLAPPSLALQVM
jgi:hypothetical protein